VALVLRLDVVGSIPASALSSMNLDKSSTHICLRVAYLSVSWKVNRHTIEHTIPVFMGLAALTGAWLRAAESDHHDPVGHLALEATVGCREEVGVKVVVVTITPSEDVVFCDLCENFDLVSFFNLKCCLFEL